MIVTAQWVSCRVTITEEQIRLKKKSKSKIIKISLTSSTSLPTYRNL
jgi:hypothetical protein